MKHKKSLIILIVVLAIVVFAFVGHNIYRYPAMLRNLSDNSLNDSQTEELRNKITNQSDINILVAYFSYSGTTKNIAVTLSEKTGGDLFEIATQDSYSDVYKESNREIRRNERPALINTVENMEKYDIVFVGYPVWWHATPAPVNTFLESYDLSGKLIIPFCTSGESDIDETMPTFLQSCDGLAVYGERRLSGTGEIDSWLLDLGLTEIDTTNTQENIESDKNNVAESETDTQTAQVEEDSSKENGGRILIAYFTAAENSGVDAVSSASYSVVNGTAVGRVGAIADMIQENTGGDLFSIQTSVVYPADGGELIDYAAKEQSENARPELTSHIENLDEYDVIFIGYPNWWYDMPMVMYSFFEEYDFSGKTIIPFNVHNGSRFSSTISTIQELEPDAVVIEDGFTINERNVPNAAEDVTDWLKGLKF